MRTLLALFVAFFIGGCAHRAPVGEPVVAPANGRLLIIGGALDSSNERVFRALERAPGNRLEIVVIPTASGVPWRAERGAIDDLHRHLDQPIVRSFDPRDHPMDRIVRAIDSADAVWFTGGDQRRITHFMRNTPAHDACRRLLERGGIIAGTSAGGAMMGDVMITGGSSFDAIAYGASDDPESKGVTYAPGMGFLAGVVVDQHFVAREREVRLERVLVASGVRDGLGVNENRAVLVDLSTGMARPIGAEACVLVRIDPETGIAWRAALATEDPFPLFTP